MDNRKNSFLVYLDSYMHVMSLPPEQQGYLFTALFWYANRVSTAGKVLDVTTSGVNCTQLSPAARMAFNFMATNIARDFEKWQEKKDNYQAAARRRRDLKQPAMPYHGRGVDVYPTREEAQALLEDA